jgi:hypothetical protein
MKRAWLRYAALLLLQLGCEPKARSEGLVRRAQFGVFFGGQVQEREQIPFEIDQARQVQGLRIDFVRPLPHPLKVSWEIDRPLPQRRATAKRRSENERVVEMGEARAQAGQARFDKVLPFKPGDPLGTWNIRVVLGQELVLDRRFLVYDADERARAQRADGGL